MAYLGFLAPRRTSTVETNSYQMCCFVDVVVVDVAVADEFGKFVVVGLAVVVDFRCLQIEWLTSCWRCSLLQGAWGLV